VKRRTDPLVQACQNRLVWLNVHNVTTSQVIRSFRRSGWKVGRVDISKCRSTDDVARALAALYPWPDFLRHNLRGIESWFLEMFDAFRTKRLCVVFDQAESEVRLSKQKALVEVLLSQLAHVRDARGKKFLDGTTGDWELSVLWLSAQKPQAPERYNAVGMENVTVPTIPVKQLKRVRVPRWLYEL